MPSPHARRRRSLGAIALVTAVLLAGCGSSDGSDGSSPTTAGSGSGEVTVTDSGTGPIAVEHRFGTTEVPRQPERVVSLDTQWTDVLLALDAPPVAALVDPNVAGGKLPWQGEQLDDVTAITAIDSLPYEQIAAQKPDLIVVTYLAVDEADWKRLSAIAPTIASLGDDQVDTWQSMAEVAGSFLDAEDEADALVTEVDGGVEAVAEELPGLAGKTFALVNFVPGDALYVVADPKDGANVVFTQLGLEIAPSILEAGPAEGGRIELSLEQASLLDADVLILLTNGGEATDIVGYEDLPAVRSGAVALLDYADIVGLNTPTPLSVPHALDRIRPALEAAAG